MKKNTFKYNQLRSIIQESVRRALNEGFGKEEVEFTVERWYDFEDGEDTLVYAKVYAEVEDDNTYRVVDVYPLNNETEGYKPLTDEQMEEVRDTLMDEDCN